MRNLKKGLAQVLAVSLAAASFVPFGPTAYASFAGGEAGGVKAAKIQDEAVVASGSDAVQEPDYGELPGGETGADSGTVKDDGKGEFPEEGERFLGIKREAENTGTCGENLTWELTDGVLAISGTGEMTSYSYAFPAPWSDLASEIKEIAIGDQVTSIGAAAFRGCDNLTEFIIPDGISSIGEGAFLECSGLTHITLPKNISFLGYETFQECSSLVSITFSNKLILIQNGVFFKCTSLTDVYYSGSESEWSGITIEDYNDPLLAATIHYNSTGPAAIDPDSLGEGILYVPYSGTIGLVNADEAEQPAFLIISGTLPKGLSLDPDTGEISGTPREAGSFKITVEVSGTWVSLREELTIVIKENTDDNIFGASDEGYELEQYIGEKTEQGYVLREFRDQLFVSAGEFEQFVALWLNGEKLVEGKNYTKKKGSTRITVRKQTLETKSKSGTNTLSAEFCNEKGELKRTSQNYTVDVKGPDKKPDPEEDEDTDSSLSSGSGGGSSSGTGKSGSGSSGGGAAPYTNESWVKDEISCFVSESVMVWTVIGNCSILTFKCWTDGQIDSIIGICEGEGRDKQEGRHYNHA